MFDLCNIRCIIIYINKVYGGLQMNILVLNVIIRTIPKVDANEWEDSKLVVRPRSEWKKEAINDFLIFLVSIIAFFMTDKLPIPYVGTFLFIGGFLGTFYGLILGTRAFLIYKAYYQIFKEDEIRKLEPSDK
jgi:hypothetical protein